MQRDTILRNTGFAFIIRLSGAAFTAALTLFLVRYLGPAEYGSYALALSVGALVLLPSDLGIAQATARFVAEAWDDKPRLTSILTDAMRLKALASAIFSIALIVLSGPIAEAYDAPQIAWPLRVLALSLFFESFFLLFSTVFQALGRVPVFLRVVLLKSSSETTLSVAIVLAGAGVTGAFAGRAAGYAFAVGYATIVLLRVLSPTLPRPSRRSGGYLRRIAGYGTALLVVDSAFTLFGQIDNLLIGAILSVEDVGLFSAPSQLLVMMGYVGLAVSSGIAPRLVKVGTRSPDRAALQTGLRYMVALQGIFLAPMIVWAGPITTYALGTGYSQSADVLRAFAPFAFMVGISPIVAMSVNYLGEARRRIPIAVAALLINAVFDIMFLPHLGIVAGAIGTSIAYAVYLGGHLVLLRSLVGLGLAPLLWGTLSALLASTCMAGVLLLFGVTDLSLISLVLGLVLGSITYAAVIIGTKTVGVEELRWGLSRAISGRRRS